MTKQQRANKAIILSRVSSKEQEEGYSIEAQTRRIQDYCLRHNLEVIKTFELIESSTVGNRQKFMEAIQFAKSQKEIIAIVTDKVDRLQRSFKESPLLNDLIDQEKIELHFHVENCVIHKYSTSNEKLMWNMNVVMSQSYVDSLKDNVNRSIEQKLLNGYWISQAPIGYLHIKGRGKDSNIIIDPERAPLIRKLFEEYAKGTYTIPQLRKETKKWQLTNSRGNQGYLSRSHIHSILTNPFYHGVMYYRKGNKHFPHVYETIIDKELFNQCQSVLKGWNRKPFKWGEIDFIFRGLIKCKATGKTVSSEIKNRVRADGTHPVYLGAWCPKDPKKRVYMKEDDILLEVGKVFKSMRLSDELLEKVIKYIKSSAKHEKRYHKQRIQELHAEHTKINNKIDKLMDFLLEDKINENDYEAKRESLLQKRDEIMSTLENYNAADDNFTETLINVLKLSSQAYKLFNLSKNGKKRELIKLVFSTLEMNGRNIEYTLRSPFDMFVETAKNGEWWGLVYGFATSIGARNCIVGHPYNVLSITKLMWL